LLYQQFDYSLIREAGSPIKGFGGVASGPAPLQELHGHVRRILGGSVERKVTVTTVVDLMNLIGKCVVSGNVRQTAEIAFGNPKSVEYIDLKNYEKNPHRADYGWTSNNSVYCELGMNYEEICERVRTNGEPGFFWLKNAQDYGVMGSPPVPVVRPAPRLIILFLGLQGCQVARRQPVPGADA